MGNTLITGNDNKNIRNDTLLGQEVSKKLREKTKNNTKQQKHKKNIFFS